MNFYMSTNANDILVSFPLKSMREKQGELRVMLFHCGLRAEAVGWH